MSEPDFEYTITNEENQTHAILTIFPLSTKAKHFVLGFTPNPDGSGSISMNLLNTLDHLKDAGFICVPKERKLQ
jgi:hypothetical protein